MKEKHKLKKNLEMRRKKLQRTKMERNNDQRNIKEPHPTSIQYSSPHIFDHNGFFT